MKFVIAPDKFKGSLTGNEFCTIAADALTDVFPQAEIVRVPLADGGDGTLAVIQHYLQAETIIKMVSGPLFSPVKASYLFSSKKKTAFIEMSEASGHRLLPSEALDCMETTTLGTGELLKDAIEKGAEHILLGIGGSATNDGGMGVAHALGYRFRDVGGNVLSPIGKNLPKVHTIEIPKKFIPSNVVIKVACDVQNPFYGPNGAAHVYASQKGASPEDINWLDKGLQNFNKVIRQTFNIDLQQIPGSGAAGGLGGGTVSFLGGELQFGIELIKNLSNFNQRIRGADWIITGEGKLDAQTQSGKTIGGVLESAQRENIPVVAFCGAVALTPKEITTMGLHDAIAISAGIPDIEEAIAKASGNVRLAITQFAHQLRKQMP